MKFDESSLYNIKSDIDGTRCPLFDLAIWKNGLAFKKIDFSETGRPVIKIAELNNGINSKTSFTLGDYGEDVFIRWDDLLFSWSGNPQTSIDVFRYRLPDGWLNQHIFKVTANEELVTKDYLYYVLKFLKPHFTQIATNKQTTGLGHVTIADLKRMSLVVPSKEVQNQIVSILKAIDDKIEVNMNINDNLTQQAQALFKEMFPGILNSNAPDLMEDVASFSNGKKRPQSTGIIPVYGGNGILAYTTKSNAENCIIIGRVGAYCGNTFICTNKCWVSDNAIQAKSKVSDSQVFIYYLLKNASLPSRHIGTGQPLMTQGILNSIPIVKPSEERIRQFITIAGPSQAIIDEKAIENNMLAALRDTLLPKLMSGEIDVSELDI